MSRPGHYSILYLETAMLKRVTNKPFDLVMKSRNMEHLKAIL
jgi:hypothetical protein